MEWIEIKGIYTAFLNVRDTSIQFSTGQWIVTIGTRTYHFTVEKEARSVFTSVMQNTNAKWVEFNYPNPVIAYYNLLSVGVQKTYEAVLDTASGKYRLVIDNQTLGSVQLFDTIADVIRYVETNIK